MTGVQTCALPIYGFKNHAKKDSTGICFIGERKFKTFLNDYLPSQPGEIETPSGTVIGKHDGLMFYTIGQRQGLKIGGHKDAKEAPWYVISKDLQRNILIATQDSHLLDCNALIAHQVHWINQRPAHFPMPISAKIRYRQTDQGGMIEHLGEDRYKIVFHTPQRAITPGQSIVFYQQERCLGGGIIVNACDAGA